MHWRRQLWGTLECAPSTSNCLIFQVTSERHKLWHSAPGGCLSSKNYSLSFVPPRTKSWRRHCFNGFRTLLLALSSRRLNSLSHSTSLILKSFHWLKINERIEYKILVVTYNLLSTTQPAYLHDLISLQTHQNTWSSSLVAVARPSTNSSLKITDRFSVAHHLVVSVINFLTHFVSHDLISLPDSSLISDHVSSPVSASSHHSHHLSPLHSFISGWKLFHSLHRHW